MPEALSANALPPAQLDAVTLLRQSGVDIKQGLSSSDVQIRLAQDGPNEIQSQPPRPAWRLFLTQFQDPLVYLLLTAVAITLTIWTLDGYQGWPVDALVILVIMVLNALIGFVQESRSLRAAAMLAELTVTTSSVIRDGRLLRVPCRALVRGDVLVLSEGDSVGADARLVEANELRLQEASLTGESESVFKNTFPLAEPAPLAERRNMVFKGTAVTQGSGLGIVTAIGMATPRHSG